MDIKNGVRIAQEAVYPLVDEGERVEDDGDHDHEEHLTDQRVYILDDVDHNHEELLNNCYHLGTHRKKCSVGTVPDPGKNVIFFCYCRKLISSH